MGRLSKNKVKEALQKHGGIAVRAARALDTERQNIQYYISKYEDVKKVQEEAKDAIVDVAESGLVEALYKKERWAIELILKTLGKNRGYDEKTDIQQFTEINFNVEFTDKPKPIS